MAPILRAECNRIGKFRLIVSALLITGGWVAALYFIPINIGQNIDGLVWHGLAVAIALTWFAPVFTLVAAAWLMGQRMQLESFIALRSTSLSPSAIMYGYAIAALLRVRWIFAASPLLMLMSATFFEGELIHLVELPQISALWLFSNLLAALFGTWAVLRWGHSSSVYIIGAALFGLAVSSVGIVRDSIRFDCPVFVETAPLPWLELLAASIVAIFLLSVLPVLRERSYSLERYVLLPVVCALIAGVGWVGEWQLHREALAAQSIYPERDAEVCNLPGMVCTCGRVATLSVPAQMVDANSTLLIPQVAHLEYLRAIHVPATLQTTIPTEVFSLPHLQSLSLPNVQLAAIPPEIAYARGLVTLSLQDNDLNELPSQLGQLRRLQVLVLTGNRLRALPPEIAELRSLSFLLVDRNQLEDLPDTFDQLTALERVALSSNQFETIPLELSRLPNLEAVALNNNPLVEVPASVCDDERILLNVEVRVAYCGQPFVE